CLVSVLVVGVMVAWSAGTPLSHLNADELSATIGAGSCCTGSTVTDCSGCAETVVLCILEGSSNSCGNLIKNGTTVEKCTGTGCAGPVLHKICTNP
ncbi:MAG: hypothetical protein JSW07_04610, partial [bacterium]